MTNYRRWITMSYSPGSITFSPMSITLRNHRDMCPINVGGSRNQNDDYTRWSLVKLREITDRCALFATNHVEQIWPTAAAHSTSTDDSNHRYECDVYKLVSVWYSSRSGARRLCIISQLTKVIQNLLYWTIDVSYFEPHRNIGDILFQHKIPLSKIEPNDFVKDLFKTEKVSKGNLASQDTINTSN